MRIDRVPAVFIKKVLALGIAHDVAHGDGTTLVGDALCLGTDIAPCVAVVDRPPLGGVATLHVAHEGIEVVGGMLTDDGIAVSLADRRTAILGGIQRDGLGLLASHRSPPTMQD